MSRLSTAVVADASANVPVSSRTGRCRLHRASRAPAALKSPSDSHNCPSTRTAARKPTTGSSRAASARAAGSGSALVTITMTAAGTATAASGSHRGRITAAMRMAASSPPDSASAPAPLRAPAHGPCGT